MSIMESTTQEKQETKETKAKSDATKATKEKKTASKYLPPVVGYGILFAAILIIVGIALLKLLPLL